MNKVPKADQPEPEPEPVPAWDREAVGVTYVYAAIAGHLAMRIRAGEFPPGGRLPGERELSEEYGVGLGTFRRALDLLRERGVLTTLPAKGTFVTGEVPGDLQL